ncbi:MAG: DinB family protein [Bacteroidetes bacterium]|nr:DinB family protein [Bacteroidota bacterium]
MRKLTLFVFTGLLLAGAPVRAQQAKTPPTLKSILLHQLQNTWNQQDWFVPVSKAVEGLTAQQAMWKPSDSSHSVGQLAYHLLFWNRQELDKFNGRKPSAFDGNNDETFTSFNEATWASTVEQLNQVMKDWETAIKNADDAKLQSWYDIIAHISTHNAYHTGQILYIRKLAGNWDPSKGVK